LGWASGTPSGDDGMYLNPLLLDARSDLGNWYSWREQHFLGAVEEKPPYNQLDPAYPALRARFLPDAKSALLYVIAHEIGHIVGYNYPVDAYQGISWTADGLKPGEDHRSRDAFKPDEPFPLELLRPLYEDIHSRTRMINLKMFTDIEEFAEASALYAMSLIPGSRMVLETRDGGRFDLLQKLERPLFAEKYAFLRRYYAAIEQLAIPRP
jgi:hypothetical protein